MKLRASPKNSRYVFQISDVRGTLPLPQTSSQRSGLRTPARPAVPQRALIDWMALMASGIEVPQPRWSHLLSAIPSAVRSLFLLLDSRRPDWAEILQILEGLENPSGVLSLACAGSLASLSDCISELWFFLAFPELRLPGLANLWLFRPLSGFVFHWSNLQA